MQLRKILALALFLIGSGFASAAAPTPPSNLTVKPLGVNSFQLKWKDNSKNEKGWEIRVALGTDTPKRFFLLPAPDLTSYVVVTNDLPGQTLSFQLTAYNGEAGAEKLSKPTPVVKATALNTPTFGNPLDLTAKTLDDGRIRIAWKDKATTELGYQIQYREGAGKWKDFGNTNPGLKFSLGAGIFLPTTQYSFRVRAFKGNPTVYTQFSNVATAKTLAFQVPSNLVATPESDGAISLKWKDRSSLEAGYEIETKSGTSAFSKLGEVSANVTSTSPITGFAFDTDHQFRIRGFRLVDGVRILTAYSSVASAKTLLLATPTDLAAATVNDASVKLTWKHNSAREFGFQIQYRETGAADFQNVGNAAANATEFTVTGLPADKSYQFRMRAYDYFTYSALSTTVQARTKHGIVGGLNPPILAGSGFLYPIQTSLPGSVTDLSATGLPAGLVFNPTSRTITGTLATGGVYSVTLTATFSDGSTSTRTLTLRSIGRQPVISGTFSTVNVPATTQKTVSITDKFSDPDTASAARVTTNKGTFDVILFSDATPYTVNNFLDYIDAGLYDNSFFHRSPAGFVVQGGGYQHTTAAGFSRIPTFPPVVNEPGLSNIRGTVAMAKLGGLPNSATSQFFVNVGDNSLNLDAQNGGFTVFGRVPASGMAVLDAINALPRGDYDITIGAGTESLTDLPVDAATAPAVLDPSQLVKITSVGAAPILTYEVLSQNTAVATAAISGNDVVITGVAPGNTTITVKAIDLDGESVSQTVAVTVP